MILLQLPLIDGDSTIEGYEKWISCTSISWNLTREFADSAKAGTADIYTGVAEIGPIEVGKSMDCSSPLVMKYGVGGGAVGGSEDYARIHVLASGAMADGAISTKPRDQCYLQFKLHNPIIASWNISGDEDSRPTETLTLWYWRVHFVYRQFDGKQFKAGPKGDWCGGWDRKAHKAWVVSPAWET